MTIIIIIMANKHRHTHKKPKSNMTKKREREKKKPEITATTVIIVKMIKKNKPQYFDLIWFVFVVIFSIIKKNIMILTGFVCLFLLSLYFFFVPKSIQNIIIRTRILWHGYIPNLYYVNDLFIHFFLHFHLWMGSIFFWREWFHHH